MTVNQSRGGISGGKNDQQLLRLPNIQAFMTTTL